MNPTWDQEWLTGTGNHMDDVLWPLVLAVAGNARLHASREVHDAAWDAFTFHENWTDSMSEEAIDRACRGDGALPIALVRSVIIAGTAVRRAIEDAEAAGG